MWTRSFSYLITDSIREQGNQVAPAELEAHLQSHEAVADCAVIGIPDEVAGEVPKAFIVKIRTCRIADRLLQEQLCEFVQNHKARYNGSRAWCSLTRFHAAQRVRF